MTVGDELKGAGLRGGRGTNVTNQRLGVRDECRMRSQEGPRRLANKLALVARGILCEPSQSCDDEPLTNRHMGLARRVDALIGMFPSLQGRWNMVGNHPTLRHWSCDAVRISSARCQI
jgi:hypothetical protein